jgi:acyl-CoA synthetase (AMP-forming)/AMP-acid ligase II
MMTLAESLRESARVVPERIAIVIQRAGHDDLAITYRQLLTQAEQYAQKLYSANVKPGEIVIIILPHSEAMVYAWVGVVLLGAVPSILPPLTEKLAPDRYKRDLTALTQFTRPSAIITYGEFADQAREAVAELSVRVLVVDEITGCDEPFNMPTATITPDSIAVLQHSSGSTGLQKGVALAHRAIFNQLHAYAQAIALNQDDVIVSWLPLYHDMGLIAAFIMPLMLRVPLVLMSPFDWVRAPQRLFLAITHYKGTLCWLPNFAYNFCAQKIRDRELQGVNLASVRAFVNCSEPTVYRSHQLFAKRFAAYGLRDGTLTTSYAMAENVFAITQSPLGAEPNIDFQPPDGSAQRLSNGKPIANTRVCILSADMRETLPENTVGEIAIFSDCMLTGYYHRDDLTQKAFWGKWFLTGDMGYLKDGEVYITGRKKDIIIVGGKNVYPQDLEMMANEVEGVHAGRVVAFGVINEQAGTEEIVVLAESAIEDEEGRMTIGDALRAYITRNTDVAVRRVEVLDLGWLIKTSSGKIARTANKEKFLAQFGS